MPHSSINRVVLVGRLTRDPQLRALPSGTALCSLRVACNGTRREPDGSYGEKPNFFNVSVFGSHAEQVARYVHKGRRIGIDGRLEWSEWEAGDGTKRQAVDIVAQRVEFLDGTGAQGHDSDDAPGYDDPGEEAGREPASVGVGIDDDVAF
jgi:single-strand DNA-binding protein